MWWEPWHNCWSKQSKQQTANSELLLGLGCLKIFLGAGDDMIFIIWLQSTVTKSAHKHGEWIACLHKPYPISHIHHVSASVRTNLLRSESHFQPFKAVPSSRKRSVASKAGQNVTTWKKDETCCQEWGTEYCQRLPTGLADNGVAISLISWYAKGCKRQLLLFCVWNNIGAKQTRKFQSRQHPFVSKYNLPLPFQQSSSHHPCQEHQPCKTAADAFYHGMTKMRLTTVGRNPENQLRLVV